MVFSAKKEKDFLSEIDSDFENFERINSSTIHNKTSESESLQAIAEEFIDDFLKPNYVAQQNDEWWKKKKKFRR